MLKRALKTSLSVAETAVRHARLAEAASASSTLQFAENVAQKQRFPLNPQVIKVFFAQHVSKRLRMQNN